MSVTDGIPETHEAAIRDQLVRASLMIGGIDLLRRNDGWVATVFLNPALVTARAAQQGLRDASVGAAAASPRLQRQIALVVDRVNQQLPSEHRMKPYGGESPLSRLHLGWSGPAISVPIGRRWLVGTP
jgi:hypothetical protein